MWKFSASERSSSRGGRKNVEVLIKRRRKKSDLLSPEFSCLLLQDFKLKRHPETLSGREGGRKEDGQSDRVGRLSDVCLEGEGLGR